MKLVISSHEIRNDEEGRYSLKDLFDASGSNKKNQPSNFIRHQSFKDVLEILITQKRGIKPMIRKPGKYGGGTWLCRELVIKYAMWISAEFEVEVIQAFMVEQGIGNKDALEINRRMKNEQLRKMTASHHGRELQKHTGVAKAESKLINEANDRLQFSLSLEFSK